MASRRQNVVRVMLYIADDLEAKRYDMAGILRQLAREVATMADDAADEPGRCSCGQPVVQPRTGRPRTYCLACSPRRKSAAKRDDQGIPDQRKGNAA